MKLRELLKDNSTIAITGNRSSGKTSLALSLLLRAKKDHPNLRIAVFGTERNLNKYLREKGFIVLHSVMDILDLRLKNTVIYIAEMAMFFDTKTKSKQLEKLMRFFDRIEHNNCKLILDTAREGYYNKFMCSRINVFLVKEVEYDSLVNGTWLKERVRAIQSASDYRLELNVEDYYVVGTEVLTSKSVFRYNIMVDSKRENVDIFGETISEIKGEK